MRRHSSAQRRHASTHWWQCSIDACFSHSAPHASQITAQARQIAAVTSLPRAIESAASWQISALSMF